MLHWHPGHNKINIAIPFLAFTTITFSKHKHLPVYLSIAPGKSNQVTTAKPRITVGDNSCLAERDDGNNPNVILRRGK
jgi:hypothetical protein